MDRKRYIPGDQVLHPGTGRTEYYQDVNGAVFRETRHDAHGNKFTTNHALDPATRYGYSGPESRSRTPFGMDPAAQYGHTVPGGQPRRSRRPARGWGPGPAAPGAAPQIGSRISAATSQLTGNTRSGEGDTAGLVFLLILALLVAGLPLGIAYLMQRKARARSLARKTIAISLAEPAWLLLLWSWLANGPLWAAAIALLLPVGYLAYTRWLAQTP